MMLLDRELRGLYSNPAMCALMGHSAADLAGKRPDEVGPPDQGAEFVRLLERTRDERIVQRVRLQVETADRRLRVFDVQYVPLMNAEGAVEAVLGIGDDVTESALAEERVQRLSRIYRALSGANEAIVRATDEADLFQRVCSAALELGDLRAVTVVLIERETGMLRYEAVSGPAAGLLLGRALSLGPETPAGTFPVMDAVRRGQPVVSNAIDLDAIFESRTTIVPRTGIRAAAGFPLRRGGEIVGGLAIGSAKRAYFDDEVVQLLASMAQDISFGLDHLARARALQSSEERYRSLVDNLDDVVFEADERGKITAVSRAIVRYGHAPEDVVGRALDAFASPVDLPRLRLRWAEAKAGQRVIFETRSMDGRGKMRTMRVLARPFFERGAFAGIHGVITDLTEKHEMEEQLRTSQKMEAVGRLAGGVAHDFNNLLTVILSSTDFALEALPPGDPARADIEEARKASTRAVGLTRQLLAFSRKQMLRPEVLDLNGLVAGLEKMLRRLLGEDIELVFYPGANLGAVKADAGQIEQVLMNLAVNARDAMPSGGRLTIRTENAAVDDEYAGRHLGMRPGSYVKIAVRDTGTGMDEVTLARIFEPFFTTKAAGKGTGLGLATVYGIVKQSNGHI
ncbi:MAG: PAS domain S-box protein, partial [Sandaracinaceae bacterium]|nr:PAS domain S-box protein [Sandaracinaceae bacterium]